MSKLTAFYCIILLSVGLNAKTINIQDETNIRLAKNDDVTFAFDVGAKTNFWSPGLNGSILDYKTEGLYLVSGRFKVKLYDSDVFSIEKYTTLSPSSNQKELLSFYKDNKKEDSSLAGVKVSLQFMKVINYLFDKQWLEGLNYEFNTRDFMGDATLKKETLFWYGKLINGERNEDFMILPNGQLLSFRTEFRSHKLFYKWDNIYSKIKGSYITAGIFDESWAKPTFVGDAVPGVDTPIIFDANYHSVGSVVSVGIKRKAYNVDAYVSYGFNNDMDMTQNGIDYRDLNVDINVHILGLNADYRWADIYSNKYFNIDMVLSGQMQYTQINQDRDMKIDAETLYGVNAGFEVLF